MNTQVKLGSYWPSLAALVTMRILSFQLGASELPSANPDTSPPELRYAGGSPAMNEVRVWFSEPVDPATAQLASNYTLSGGLNVSAAAVGVAPTDNTVVLTTSRQPEGATLTLTVNNVKDLAGNVIAPGSSRIFKTHLWLRGQVLHEYWDKIAGTTGLLRADKRFPSKSTFSMFLPSFEFPPGGASQFSDNYGNKLSTWFVPPETGDYVFFVCSDDGSSLYLSTDTSPANKKLIATEAGWSVPRAWMTANDGLAANKRSDKYSRSQWPPAPKSPIHLDAAKKYYLEALHAEGGGDDNISATFMKVGESEPADGSEPRLAGNAVGYYLDPNIELNITRQPSDQPAFLPSKGISLAAVDFTAETGGFTVNDTKTVPPGPWEHNPGLGWVADGSSSGCDGAGQYASHLNSPDYILPQDGAVSIAFSHRYSFEPTFDGGQVRYSINGLAFRPLPADSFSAGGYAPNPIAPTTSIITGQRAFNLDSPGYDQGEFVTTKASLGIFSKGDKIKFQFRGAWDGCSTGTHPNWQIASLQIELLPAQVQDFTKADGGFIAEQNPPGSAAIWTFSTEAWTVHLDETNCTGPFVTTLTSPTYSVPASDGVVLNFSHTYSFADNGPDAGQVRLSVNGGPFLPIPPERFTQGGYPSGVGAGPGLLAGQRGFRGTVGLVASSAALGQFAPNDKIAVQFLAAWGDCTGGRTSSWQIKNLQLVFGHVPQAVTFQAQANASLYGEERGINYQWQRQETTNFVDLAGEISPALRFFPTEADFQTAFRLELSVPGTSVYTRPVKLASGTFEPPTVLITSSHGKAAIAFTGALQSAARPEGPYTDVAGAVSPYPVPDNQRAIFFRSTK